MRVIEVERFGGPEVLRVKTVPDPHPGPGQIVVEVKVAGVLSIDTVIRRGEAGELFPVSPPYVPGAGAAGQVTEIGDGVDGAWCGEWVLADVDGGGYAEQVLATPDQLIRIPPGVGLREAMALLHDGATALAVVERAEAHRGETVLVQPAGGGLGSLLVQLAHTAGARVIGAARGAEKLETVRALGADAVVDYSEPGWASRVGPVDVAFDGVGGDLGREAGRAGRAVLELRVRRGRAGAGGGGGATGRDRVRAGPAERVRGGPPRAGTADARSGRSRRGAHGHRADVPVVPRRRGAPGAGRAGRQGEDPAADLAARPPLPRPAASTARWCRWSGGSRCAAPATCRRRWPWKPGGCLQFEDLTRLRQCADDGCGRLFLDRSRNGSRRWCSSADCGNRDRARRHCRRVRD